jgi:hypothetical protein
MPPPPQSHHVYSHIPYRSPSSVVIRNARVTLGLADILQERPAVHLHQHRLDLLLLIDQEHVDAPDPQRRVVPLPAPRDAVAGMEHVERLDAGERRLRALAVDELLLAGEADLAQGGALQVVDTVRVVGEVVGEQRVGERDVEVFHCVFEHVDETIHDCLRIGLGEAKLAQCRVRAAMPADGQLATARVVADGRPGGWGGERDAEEGRAGEGQGHENREEMHGLWAFFFGNEWIRRKMSWLCIDLYWRRGWGERKFVGDGSAFDKGLYVLSVPWAYYLISVRFGNQDSGSRVLLYWQEKASSVILACYR